MRKAVLFVGIAMLVVSAALYLGWWYWQADLAELAQFYTADTWRTRDYLKARYAFSVARMVSLILAGCGVLAGIIAYTPWVWESRQTDRG